MNSNLSGQIQQCEQVISQLVAQTQQASQNYQQLLQQEQQNSIRLEELAQREHKASQIIQTALQGHQTAIQQLQHISQTLRQVEQSAMSTSVGNGIQSSSMGYSTGYQPSYNQFSSPSYNQQPLHTGIGMNVQHSSSAPIQSSISQGFGSQMNQGRSFQ